MSDDTELVSPERSSSEVVHVQNTPPATMHLGGGFSFDIEKIIEKAVTVNAAVDVMERLMAMRREVQAEWAKKQYDMALAGFQKECPPIKKRKAVFNRKKHDNDPDVVRYKFAPLDDIVDQVKPLLEKYGFSYDLDAKVEPSWVRAIITVKHRDGHSEQKSFGVPIDTEGFMTLPQKYGSAMTFAKRYVFVNAFGIMTSEEDTDGADPTEKPKAEPPGMGEKKDAVDALLKRELTDLTRHIHGIAGGYNLDARAKQSLRQWLTDEDVIRPDETVTGLTGGRLAEVVAKAKKKLGK